MFIKLHFKCTKNNYDIYATQTSPPYIYSSFIGSYISVYLPFLQDIVRWSILLFSLEKSSLSEILSILLAKSKIEKKVKFFFAHQTSFQ